MGISLPVLINYIMEQQIKHLLDAGSREHHALNLSEMVIEYLLHCERDNRHDVYLTYRLLLSLLMEVRR